jgi:prolyl-tRNA synthetase
MRGAVSGANRADEHLVNIDLERDVPSLVYADLRQARAGDRCPRCDGGTFAGHRGIEVGQVFYLGTKYSTAMGAQFLGADGAQRPIEMGCYGIGITRTVAAAIEQHHDDAGIVWPAPLAPYGALVVPVSSTDAQLVTTAEDRRGARGRRRRHAPRRPRRAAGRQVQGCGPDRPAGARDRRAARVARGCVELKRRTDEKATEVPVGEAAARAAALVGDR